MKILCFGVARDIVGNDILELDLGETSTVAHLRECIMKKYPDFEQFSSFMIAVNQSYASSDEMELSINDELAIIPPVSGG